jgi:predicted nuclease of restriction endonuclease-like RecB superfamily
MLIPANELHITGPEWKISDLTSIEHYDSAIAALIETIARIEADLGSPKAILEPEWAHKARKVLSMRRSALTHVYVLRKECKRSFAADWAHAFVNATKVAEPGVYARIAASLQKEDLREAA